MQPERAAQLGGHTTARETTYFLVANQSAGVDADQEWANLQCLQEQP